MSLSWFSRLLSVDPHPRCRKPLFHLRGNCLAFTAVKENWYYIKLVRSHSPLHVFSCLILCLDFRGQFQCDLGFCQFFNRQILPTQHRNIKITLGFYHSPVSTDEPVLTSPNSCCLWWYSFVTYAHFYNSRFCNDIIIKLTESILFLSYLPTSGR